MYFESKKIICAKVTKTRFIIGHKVDPKHTIIPKSDYDGSIFGHMIYQK